ncbi:hypothetical protein [Porphyromonas gingivalis]|uniref:Uncharacterized protein n=1 Tax=Porphyromonas gingivalis TaxID=837 RepID=A0AAE9XCK9_PORGN|nr:hypothetical protein [Porphyromonas gingivalis]WCG04203.1 hypothetical protein NY151_02740 [Porphyromonas gingivalis]
MTRHVFWSSKRENFRV